MCGTIDNRTFPGLHCVTAAGCLDMKAWSTWQHSIVESWHSLWLEHCAICAAWQEGCGADHIRQPHPLHCVFCERRLFSKSRQPHPASVHWPCDTSATAQESNQTRDKAPLADIRCLAAASVTSDAAHSCTIWPECTGKHAAVTLTDWFLLQLQESQATIVRACKAWMPACMTAPRTVAASASRPS